MLVRKVPVKKLSTAAGDVYVATVFDLMCGNYGVDRGLDDRGVAGSYDAQIVRARAMTVRTERRAAGND